MQVFAKFICMLHIERTSLIRYEKSLVIQFLRYSISTFPEEIMKTLFIRFLHDILLCPSSCSSSSVVIPGYAPQRVLWRHFPPPPGPGFWRGFEPLKFHFKDTVNTQFPPWGVKDFLVAPPQAWLIILRRDTMWKCRSYLEMMLRDDLLNHGILSFCLRMVRIIQERSIIVTTRWFFLMVSFFMSSAIISILRPDTLAACFWGPINCSFINAKNRLNSTKCVRY